jgi:hypothetical protein
MQEYLPSALRSVPPRETTAADVIRQCAEVSVVRRLRLLGGRRDGGSLVLEFDGAPSVEMDAQALMRFGTETVRVDEYVKRVLEPGDFVDVVIEPHVPSCRWIWIHIEYEDERLAGLEFAAKDDGLFAMRARAGEKAESIVRRILERCDPPHRFAAPLETSDRFVIRYRDKKRRAPDLKCSACGVAFEVKKRNRDRQFRISHSTRRPFETENAASDWHVFVFPDMTTHFVSNAEIHAALAAGRVRRASDRYDSWADLLPPVAVAEPPVCG